MHIATIEARTSEALELVVALSALPLLPSVIVGLCSSILQAATQIQDQSLSFVPKLVAVFAVLYFFGGQAVEWYMQFTNDVFLSMR